jgi:hypothetical protein
MILALAAVPARADVAPCYPAVSCNPSVAVDTGGGTGTNSGVTLTINNLVPGTTVTVTWVAFGQTQTATAVVGADGTARVPIGLLEPGTTTFTVNGFTTNAQGQRIAVTRTAQVTVANNISLVFYTEGMKALSILRTRISGDPAAFVPSQFKSQKVAKMAGCPAPFRYRIQKRKVQTINRGSDEPVVRVTWTTLPKKYKTNKISGVWGYQDVNLKKGTYRSVVNGKCGLLGGTTNTTTLKK